MTDSDQGSEQLVFRALADPTRRAIIHLLAERPLSVGEVASKFDVTRNAVVKHIAILEEGGLVETEAKGRERINRLRPGSLRPAEDWFNHFNAYWDDKLAALKNAVETKRDDK